MANYKKKGDKMPKGKPFVPGDPRAGRKPNPPELNEIKRMSSGDFKLLIHKLIDLKPNELENFKGTVLEAAMASAMEVSIKSGDFFRIQGFIDRLFGKVTDKIEHSGKVELGSLSDDDLDREIEEHIAKRKKK